MPKPLQGSLLQIDSTSVMTPNIREWVFQPGTRNTNKNITLTDFTSKAHTLISTHQLFEGHPRHSKLYQLRNNMALSNIVSRYIDSSGVHSNELAEFLKSQPLHTKQSMNTHVSAAGLSTTDVPTLPKHKNLNPNDKAIWDSAYAEEYDGLANLPAWITITESQYQKIKHKCGTLLPTMAISTIKYDENRKPKRAKYRIVALGNLDPHEWTKSDVYAPVMSLLEVRLLASMAVRDQCVLQAGDVKQAFVQSKLPKDEVYVLRPPAGCPKTPPNSYWLLKRSLYGLKRAPRHWFQKMTKIFKSIGLQPCPNAPCIFSGSILPNKPKLYLGVYVDDFIYYSTDKSTEQEFEKQLAKHTPVDFMGPVSHYLGIKFQWRQTSKRTSVHLSQEAFSDNIIEQIGLDLETATCKPTPYRSGYPVDKIKDMDMKDKERKSLQKQVQHYVGSLLWLSQGTRPDLSVITSILAQHQNNPSPGHLSAIKHVLKYLKGTKSMGIAFHSDQALTASSYVHFPIDKIKLMGMADANWGPQDQSRPDPSKPIEPLDLFKSRSISGHLISLHGPLHWMAKRQSVTARSSAESEIYATDECVKQILFISMILEDLGLHKKLLGDTTTIYNDNMACIHWARNKTSKNTRHMQIRENAIRESVQNKKVQIVHIDGKTNLADLFTKEDKDIAHFITIRNQILCLPFPPTLITTDTESILILSHSSGGV